MWDAELDEVLQNVALLSSLTADERTELGSTGRVVRARRGSTLIRQGDEAGGMSVVLSGQVRIDLELRDGRRQTLAVLSTGEVFGELSLLDYAPRSASAIADSDARVFLINAEEFEHLRTAHRPAAYKILRAIGPTLCRRLRGIEQLVAERLAEARDGAGEGSPAPAQAAPETEIAAEEEVGEVPSPPPLPLDADASDDPSLDEEPMEVLVVETLADDEPTAANDAEERRND